MRTQKAQPVGIAFNRNQLLSNELEDILVTGRVALSQKGVIFRHNLLCERDVLWMDR